jgi:hypothetical protein
MSSKPGNNVPAEVTGTLILPGMFQQNLSSSLLISFEWPESKEPLQQMKT